MRRIPSTAPHRRRSPLMKRGNSHAVDYAPYTSLDFFETNQLALVFANHIQIHFEEIADILLSYESFEVVRDETDRALDILQHLEENKQYFVLRIGSVASFLPRNQPLYSLACFVAVPALMASEVHFRIPHCMRYFFPKLLDILEFGKFFPNVTVSQQEQLKFLREQSALRIDPQTEESLPLTETAIFTGTVQHAERLRMVFDQRTLFIANGAGHNPMVIAEDADITSAVDAALTVQLYNQGQDCSAPNAILVHRRSFRPFIKLLRARVGAVRVGHYRDRSCRVGPISEPEDLQRIQTLLVENRQWLDSDTDGVIRTKEAIVEPSIVCKPLREGGNFAEVFAPIFFVQQYDDDNELAKYFETPQYARNAMYLSLFGTSPFVAGLVGRSIGGQVLHEPSSLLHNTHPHAPGVERGTQPYGGNGYAASSISIHGKIFSKATLPQRDIFEHVIQSLLENGKAEERKSDLYRMKKILVKDVRKLLGLQTAKECESRTCSASDLHYVDLSGISKNGCRYAKLDSECSFRLLSHPNVAHLATMEPKFLHYVRALKKYLASHQQIAKEELLIFLYALPKKQEFSTRKNHTEQLKFFQNVYQLLFGKDSGPRLAQFLADVERSHILYLLDV